VTEGAVQTISGGKLGPADDDWGDIDMETRGASKTARLPGRRRVPEPNLSGIGARGHNR